MINLADKARGFVSVFTDATYFRKRTRKFEQDLKEITDEHNRRCIDMAKVSDITLSALTHGDIQKINYVIKMNNEGARQMAEAEKHFTLMAQHSRKSNERVKWLDRITIGMQFMCIGIYVALWEGTPWGYCAIASHSIVAFAFMYLKYSRFKDVEGFENIAAYARQYREVCKQTKKAFKDETHEALTTHNLNIGQLPSGLVYHRRDENLIDEGYLCEVCLDVVDGSRVYVPRTCKNCAEDIEEYGEYLPN